MVTAAVTMKKWTRRTYPFRSSTAQTSQSAMM